jgi:hypothetical protein
MMNKDQRQLARRIGKWAKSGPANLPDDVWSQVHDLVESLMREADECRKNAAFWQGRFDEFNGTVVDQLAETKTSLTHETTRRRKVEDALDEAVKIARKDRAASWKKATNPDFQFLCECEDTLLAEKHEADKEADFRDRAG